MFCGKCGTQIPDGSAVCSNCGAELKTPGVVAPKSGSSFNFKDPKILGIGAVVIAVVLLFTLVFGGQSYKSAVNNFMDGIFDANSSKVFKALPDELIEMACEEEDMTRKELRKEMDGMLEDLTDYFDYFVGEDWSVKFKIKGTEKYDSDDLKDIKEEYKEIDIKVKDAKIVIVEMTVKADGASESTELEIGVIKVGGSWYVDVQNVDLPF